VSEDVWQAVDRFVGETLVGDDEALKAALVASAESGLPEIQVSPPQGKLLQLLVRLLGATSILEFGTLGGYSSILMARAMQPGGRLISLEADPGHAQVARANLDRAGVGEKVEIRVGPALDSLPRLEADGVGPFDLVFIDADKVSTPDYFAWALERTRVGGLIIADNVVRGGSLADADSEDPATRAQRRLHEAVAAEPRVSATTIQTVGSKGYDGFLVALVGAA
jgi:predicted O-methyltransferase YrrM